MFYIYESHGSMFVDAYTEINIWIINVYLFSIKIYNKWVIIFKSFILIYFVPNLSIFSCYFWKFYQTSDF